MATYRVSAPDGSSWEVNAPDTATEDAVMSYAKAQWSRKKDAPTPDWKPSSPTEGMGFGEQALAGAGKAFVDLGRGAGQMLGMTSQQEADEAKKLDAPLMDTGGGMTGNIGANLLTALVPGAGSVKGAALVGGALSALQPTATGESRAQNTLTGLALGGGGAGAGKLIGKGMTAASSRMEKLAEKVNAKAVADAASETASARSAAGRAAQDTYKQMEHLRELKAVGSLTEEQSKIYKELSKELAQKAQDKFLPSAAVKKETAQLYREAMETESERAAKMAAEKLSGKEAKNQAMARLKRYGPAAVGGVVGNALFPGLGAIGGAATGLVLRPAIHSMRRLAQNPAVQYQMLRPIANSGMLGDLADPRLLGLLGPSIYAAQE